MMLLFLRSISLDGASDGMNRYGYPRFDHLATLSAWTEAARHVMLSLGLGLGGNIVFASFNHINTRVYDMGVAMAVLNFLCSLFVSIIIVSILGFQEKVPGHPTYEGDVEDFLADGTSLFVVMLSAMVKMPGLKHLWAIIYLLMLIAFGMDTMYGLMITVKETITDFDPRLRAQRMKIWGALCTCGIVGGLSMCFSAGQDMIQTMELATFRVMYFIVLIEVIATGWLYGAESLVQDMKGMGLKFNYPMKLYWIACWKFVTPLLMLALAVTDMAGKLFNVTIGYAGQRKDGNIGADVLLWLQVLTTLLPLPVGFHFAWKRFRNKPLWSSLSKPDDEWIMQAAYYRKIMFTDQRPTRSIIQSRLAEQTFVSPRDKTELLPLGFVRLN